MVVFIIRRIIKRSVILWVRRRKTAFPTPAHQRTTARNAATACALPAMSRNFVTAAVNVKTFPKRKHTATHMRALIIIKPARKKLSRFIRNTGEFFVYLLFIFLLHRCKYRLKYNEEAKKCGKYDSYPPA